MSDDSTSSAQDDYTDDGRGFSRAYFLYYHTDDGGGFSYLPVLIYIGYFVGIVCLLHVIDECISRPHFKLGYKLTSAAYLRSQYNTNSVDGLPSNFNIDASETRSMKTCALFCISFCISFSCVAFDRTNEFHQKYSDEFKRFVLLGYNSKVYNAIGNIVFKTGSLFGDLGRNFFQFPLGFLEDFVFHIINFNLALSTLFADIQSPYTRMHRRIVFFCQGILALFLQIILAFVAVLSASASKYGDDDSYTLYSDGGFVFLITVFVLSPLMIFMNKLMYYLFVCPCLLEKNEKTENTVQSNGSNIEIRVSTINSTSDSRNNSDDDNIHRTRNKSSPIFSQKTLNAVIKACG